MIFWLLAGMISAISGLALSCAIRRLLLRPWQTAVILILPFGGICFYAWHGSPNLLGPYVHDDKLADPNLPELVNRLESQMADRPHNERGWRLLARSAPLVGRDDLALMALEKLVTLNPDNPADWVALGTAHVHYAEGHITEEARSAFDKALAHDPNHLEALWFLGHAAHQKQDLGEALQRWEHLATLIDSNHPIWREVNDQINRLKDGNLTTFSEEERN